MGESPHFGTFPERAIVRVLELSWKWSKSTLWNFSGNGRKPAFCNFSTHVKSLHFGTFKETGKILWFGTCLEACKSLHFVTSPVRGKSKFCNFS